jgi:hypothetical protein
MIIGANQKTTISAGISAAASFVMFASQPPLSIQFPQWMTAVAMFAMVGGLAALGINAKDSNVTGGSVVQPGIPVADPDTVAHLAVVAATPLAQIKYEGPGPANLAKW